MPFYFIGGEDYDFTKLGVCSVDTATANVRRTGFTRCALKIGPMATFITTDGWTASFSSPQSQFWFTARNYLEITGNNSTGEGIVFMDGAVRRLFLTLASASGFIQLKKKDNAGTNTILATASVSPGFTTLQKFDVFVNYAVAGQVKVYLGGTLIIDYSGDVTTNGATSLSGFVLGSFVAQLTAGTAYSSWWSEVICASYDTRSLSLVTLPPLANGNAFTFTTGSATNLDEVTLDDADTATSQTAGQIAQSTVTSTGITGNPPIVALAVTARVQKGSSGPSKADLGVRTASTDYWSSDIVLPVALDRISNVWETNPNTSAPWLYSDLTAAGFNIGVKSVT
jgi:hypothetical protein